MIIDRENDTICAVATPFGRGGISVIRVSGERALAIARALCPFMPADSASHQVYYGILSDASGPVDEVMATYFKKGRSFSGEDSVEISCHGNPVLCERILQALTALGARTADRGEFTYRAFMNGRIDLIQAESVLSLIESQTRESSRLALQQLQGELSKNLEKLESDLTWCLAHIEASIDFSTEGLDTLDHKVLGEKLGNFIVKLQELVDSYTFGRLLKDGVRVAIVGQPNVGKSSLLNRLVEDERAIVTAQPGTTRDLVSAETIFEEQKFSLQDTAGLREQTEDEIEKMGIQKTRSAMGLADYLLFVLDGSRDLTPEEHAIFAGLDLDRSFVIINKKDLRPQGRANADEARAYLEPLFSCKNFKDHPAQEAFLKSQVLWVSSFDKTARAEILRALKKFLRTNENENSVLVIQARHFENLSLALKLVTTSRDNLSSGSGSEFLALDLKQALMGLQEVLGKRYDDQIMDRVFKEFCIGK